MRATPLAVAGALVLTLAACGGSGGGSGAPGGSPVDGKTLTFAIGADPGNLDPHFTSLSQAYQVGRFVYDSLINLDKNNKIVSGLAEKWEGDSSTVTYTLRKGITCADGTPLTAEAVADNINFVGDPKNKSSRIGLFVPAKATAKADDEAGTVTVTSPSPDAFLLRNVGTLPIVCPKGMEDRKLLERGSQGTGPYTLTSAKADDQYVLTKRKGYAWGPGNFDPKAPGMPAKVVLKVIGNETTATNLLLSGQIQMLRVVGPEQRRLSPMKELHRRAMLAPLGLLWFNQKKGEPTADVEVRRALVQALDLKKVGQVMSSGQGKTPTGLMPTGTGPCDTDSYTGSLPPTDVNAAKAALEAAGWKAGSDGVRVKDGERLELSFYYGSSLGPAVKAGAELVQKAWQAAGAEVTLKGVTDTQVAQTVVAGEGDWSTGSIPLTVSVPAQFVPFVSGPSAPDGGTNFSAIDNPDYLAAVEKAAAKPDTAGCADWAAAEKALFSQVNVVPFVNSPIPYYGKGVTFEITGASIAPTSIRMLG